MCCLALRSLLGDALTSCVAAGFSRINSNDLVFVLQEWIRCCAWGGTDAPPSDCAWDTFILVERVFCGGSLWKSLLLYTCRTFGIVKTMLIHQEALVGFTRVASTLQSLWWRGCVVERPDGQHPILFSFILYIRVTIARQEARRSLSIIVSCNTVALAAKSFQWQRPRGAKYCH